MIRFDGGNCREGGRVTCLPVIHDVEETVDKLGSSRLTTLPVLRDLLPGHE